MPASLPKRLPVTEEVGLVLITSGLATISGCTVMLITAVEQLVAAPLQRL